VLFVLFCSQRERKVGSQADVCLLSQQQIAFQLKGKFNKNYRDEMRIIAGIYEVY
jgi:hypothetical protein